MHSYQKELDAITASDEYKGQLIAAMKKEREAPRAGGRKKRGSAAAWLIPTAAVLIAIVVVCSVPTVSRAISDWIISTLRLERYMEAGHDDADTNPDIEKAITRVGPSEQSYEIRLLDEIPATDSYSFEGIDEWRVKQGQKAFAREDWAWLYELKPEVREVLYDGKNLIITTFYGCDDPAPFARGYLVGMDSGAPSLDILTFDISIRVNGVEQPNYGYGTSLDFSKWYERSGAPDFSLEELAADGGVYGITELELEGSPAFPDGLCEIEMVQTVQDNHVDNMSVIGMVAQIIHRFSFDTTAGNAALSLAELEPVALTGTTPLTVTYWGGGKEQAYIVNEQLSFDGVTLTPLVSRRSTGIHVTLRFDYPEGRAEFLREDLRRAIERSLDFELYIDGEYVDRLDSMGSSDELLVEISLTPSELERVSSIVLKPVVGYYTQIAGRDMTGGERILLPYSGGFSYDPSAESETPLIGCDIVIPPR